jgi:broad specificity phosphatase PhoE
MIKLAMVRHGQTNDNFNRFVQGRKNNPLNEMGKKQAYILGQTLLEENKSFDFILSSPLSRALETAWIVSHNIGYDKPIEIVQHLVERDFFHLEGKPVDEAMPLVRKKGFRYPGYEDDEKIINRVVKSIYSLLNTHDNQTLLCVAHSHVIKSLLVYCDPKTFSFSNYLLSNGDVVYFEIYKDKILFKDHLRHSQGAL